jgi:cytochrome d ubiquinol oxidase subunit II
MPERLVLALALVVVITYGVFAGADFGGGIWDILARGDRKREQRDAIAHAMGPVWEANHVWLIFLIVILFSSFPPVFAALSIALFVPFHLALLGITLRGAAFVFRAQGRGETWGRALWGTAFGAASVITPVVLGMCLGAVSTGGLRVRDGEVVAPATTTWLAPLALAMGLFALAICAYLAAVYLTNETTGALQEDFRRRALWAGTAVVALSAIMIPLVEIEAPHLWNGLLGPRGLPVVGAGAVSALASGWALWQKHLRIARATAVAQVALLLAGWGIAQYPFVIFPDLSIDTAAGPRATILFVLYTLPIAIVLVIPSLLFLFVVFKGAEATRASR